MITSIENKKEKRLEIDLNGPSGNAFCLMGIGKQLARRVGRESEWGEIQKRMMDGDYENLLKVFEEEFGDYVVLFR